MNDRTRAQAVRGWIFMAAVLLWWLLSPPPSTTATACAFVPFILPFAVVMCCCGCTVVCSYCNPTDAPCEMEVVITGVVNGTCTECAAANDTFLSTSYAEIGAVCAWNGPSSWCGNSGLPLTHLFNGSGADTNRYLLVYVVPGGLDWFRHVFTAGENDPCSGINVSPAIFSTFGTCNITGATCDVTGVGY